MCCMFKSSAVESKQSSQSATANDSQQSSSRRHYLYLYTLHNGNDKEETIEL
eukprot:m.129540 g.129540  ORF g.129540 m.129540 type:complete len:52 (-) comp13891_c0_seq1:769-924(-)